MSKDDRLYLHQLACEVAFRILTAEQPALALATFDDDLADEIAAGRANLALSQAFRDAIGYSVRVDALGEESAERRDHPGSVRASASRTSPGSSPSVLRVVDGGES